MAVVAPYRMLLPKQAGQREHPLREVFNGLRYVVKIGAPWRWMPNDLLSWAAVYQQTRGWTGSRLLRGPGRGPAALRPLVRPSSD
jgi:transposase